MINPNDQERLNATIGGLEDDQHDIIEAETSEAYCVKCRHTVEILDPVPVWTSKGTPGTRGVCPDCGTPVFRMGRTPAHEKLQRPTYIKVEGPKIATGGGRRRAQPATYINYAPADAEFAQQLATDLENAGVHTWINLDQSSTENVQWAGGVHPALKDSRKMVVILSKSSQNYASLSEGWTFFKGQKRPIVVVLLEALEVPDALRRSPRFDFSADYKQAFRQLLSTLSE